MAYNRSLDIDSRARSFSDPIVLDYHDVTIRQSDLDTLNPSNWLSDNIISFSFEHQEHNNQQENNQKLFTFISPPVVQLLKLSESTTAKHLLENINFLDKQFVFLALNDNSVGSSVGGSHWSLIILYVPGKVMYHFDSMFPSNESAAKQLYQKLDAYCEQNINCSQSPQQINYCDCGLLNIIHHFPKMSGRTPSFILVGLIIILLLLGMYYMSCSSKNNELRISLEDFEERVRSLTMKNADYEHKIDTINTRKRDLEEEKVSIQRQTEKKDSEINELNIKLNEKLAELQSIKSDKQVLYNQLKEFKTLSESISSKDTLIEQMKQQLEEHKHTKDNLDSELAKLRQEIEQYKAEKVASNQQPQQLPYPVRGQPQPLAEIVVTEGLPVRPRHQRFLPLQNIDPNQNNNPVPAPASSSIPSFLQPLQRLMNLTSNLQNQLLPSSDNSNNNDTRNQKAHNDANNPEHVLAPPLINPSYRSQQQGYVEPQQLRQQQPIQHVTQQQQQVQEPNPDQEDRPMNPEQQPHPIPPPI
ncbi:unnamed protein product, partial [Didymodactylos carnosus]